MTKQVGFLAIQCTASNGETGTYLYSGDHPRTGELLTAVHADSVELYRFLNANGWTQEPYNQAHPCGVYSRPAPVAMVAQPVQQAQARDVRGPVADTITLPSHWGVYLVNGDASALDDGEAETIDAYVAEKLPAGGRVVDMVEGTGRFTWSFDLYGGNAKGGDVADFTVLAPAMVPQPCQQQQGRARAPKPARGERRYVTVRDTETGEVHRVLTSVAHVGVAVVIFTPSNRHRDSALGGMLITHDDRRKAWVFNDEAEARRCLSSNRAPGERVIRAELISDPAAA